MSAIDTLNGKPETAREALDLWDRGQPVFTAEMGGLGPGYEQCIHVMAFEFVRELLARDMTRYWADADAGRAGDADAKARARRVSDEIEAAVMPRITDLGSSGAQFGAAQSIAYRTVRKGWAAALSELPDDRLIQVSRTWPRVESTTSENERSGVPVTVDAVDPVSRVTTG